MSLPPVPCAHCGMNFMRHNIDPEAPRLCNNCVIKDQQRNPKPPEKWIQTVNLLVPVERKTQVEVEEICMNQGFSIGTYFEKIHRAYKGDTFNLKVPEVEIEEEPEVKPCSVKVFQKKSRGAKK